MDKKQIILIGGGGHCKSCIDVIEQTGQYEIAGIIDLPEKLGAHTLGYKVIGNDDEIESFSKDGYSFLVTLGQIKSAAARMRIFNHLKEIGAKIETIVSPRAYVSESALVSEGTIVMHGVHLNSSSTIGSNSIINTCAIIEHDAVVGDHCHISTGAIVNGETTIGNACFIGSNAVISSQVSVAQNCIIGAGTVVNKSIDAEGTYIGNPAKKIK